MIKSKRKNLVLKKFIRRYTTISSVIDMLRNREIVLLDPQTWDDKNDRYFMGLYKEKLNADGLYALCCTQVSETYHHWRVFTGMTDGACIEFKRIPLERALKNNDDIRFGTVTYMLIEDIEKLTRDDADRLPFVKRKGFSDEREYRIVAHIKGSQASCVPIDIRLDWINHIYLNPWLPERLSQAIIATLKDLPHCENLSITKSRLIDSSKWKKAGDRVMGKNPPQRKLVLKRKSNAR